MARSQRTYENTAARSVLLGCKQWHLFGPGTVMSPISNLLLVRLLTEESENADLSRTKLGSSNQIKAALVA